MLALSKEQIEARAKACASANQCFVSKKPLVTGQVVAVMLPELHRTVSVNKQYVKC